MLKLLAGTRNFVKILYFFPLQSSNEKNKRKEEVMTNMQTGNLPVCIFSLSNLLMKNTKEKKRL
jgi:hypothetical protein